jgi:hypothetical protein
VRRLWQDEQVLEVRLGERVSFESKLSHDPGRRFARSRRQSHQFGK